MKVSEREAAWAAFEVEAMPHAAGLFRLAIWLERDRTEAEDLVQETRRKGMWHVENVDYWDRLGWRDPFSSSLFTSRQSQSDARVCHGNSMVLKYSAVNADQSGTIVVAVGSTRSAKVAGVRTALSAAATVDARFAGSSCRAAHRQQQPRQW